MSLASITSLNNELHTVLNKMGKVNKKAVEAAFMEFLDAQPDVHGICWAQYTTYFNDGDPCHFSTHEFCLKLTKTAAKELLQKDIDSEEDNLRDVWESDSWKLGRLKDDRSKAISKAFSDFYSSLVTDELFERVFGDHVKVIVSRDGLKVESYTDHE